MKTQEFINQVEKAYNKHFPESKCFAKLKKNFYPDIWVECYLAGNSAENSGLYWDNDIFRVKFQIENENGQPLEGIDLESELPNLKIESIGKTYSIKPENSMYAFGTRKLSFRKTSGDAEKILSALDKFFASLKKSIVEDFQAGNIQDKKHLEVCQAKL
jgi:hypothetical protein